MLELFFDSGPSLFKTELKKSKKKKDREMLLDLLNVWKQREIPLILEEGFEKKDEFTFIFKDTLFRVNFSIKAIIVNVQKKTCHSNEELDHFLLLLREYYQLDAMVDIIKDTNTLWYLKFAINNKNVDRIKEKLSNYSEFYNIYEKDDGLEVVVDIRTCVHHYSDRKVQNYLNLRKIFKLFSEVT